MEKREANSRVVKLFNEWKRDFRDNRESPTDEYYKRERAFIRKCKELHNVVGLYEVLSDKNALKMASICSSLRFVPPFQMLMQLQHLTNSY